MPHDHAISREHYAELLAEIFPAAIGYARSILRNREDAEDAVEQSALRAWTHIPKYDPGRSFKAWWFTILRHCCLDILRNRRDTEELDGSAVAAKSTSIPGEDWEALAVAIDKLSPEHAEILRLRYFSEMSYGELAEATSIPVGTVMSRLHAARLRLAEQWRRTES